MCLWLAGPICRREEYSWSHQMIGIHLFALDGWMKRLLITSDWLDFHPEEPHRERVSSSQILAITSLWRIPFPFFPSLSILGQALWTIRPSSASSLRLSSRYNWQSLSGHDRMTEILKIRHLLVRFYHTCHLKAVKWLNFCNSELAPARQRLHSFALKNSCYYHHQLCDFAITLWNWRLWNPDAERAATIDD